jgi:hypothetical protein
MAEKRRRQVRVSWREGFCDYELVYSDAPMQRVLVKREREVEERLEAEGWSRESLEGSSGNWVAVYSKLADAARAGLYQLDFVTNSEAIGPPAKEYRAAVAIHGDVAVCSAPQGDAVAEVFRLRDGAWEFATKLKPRFPTDTSWLPGIWLDETQLLISAPLSGKVLRFERRDEGWVELDSLRVELGDFGLNLAIGGGRVAANGWQGGNVVTVIRDAEAGPFAVETRLRSPEEKKAHTVSLSEDWLAVATGQERGRGDVFLYRAVTGGWRFAGLLDRGPVTEEANFGAAVQIVGDRLVATFRPVRGGRPGAQWYRLREGRWQLESAIELPDLDGEQYCSWAGNTLAIGFPYCHGSTGRVAVLVEERGAWRVAEELAPAQLRLGDRFGESLCLDGPHLIVGAQGSVSGGGCGYIYKRTG